jgi:hypothetical protein
MLMRRMTTLPGFCLMVMRGASGMKRLTRGNECRFDDLEHASSAKESQIDSEQRRLKRQ